MAQDARLGADPLAWLKKPSERPKQTGSRASLLKTTPAGKAHLEPGPEAKQPAAEVSPEEQAPDRTEARRREAKPDQWPLEVLARSPWPLLVINEHGGLLQTSKPMADLLETTLDELLASAPDKPLFLCPGPTSLAGLAALAADSPLRMRPLLEQGPGPVLTAAVETVEGPDGPSLAFFFTPDESARAAQPEDGLEEVLDTVQGSEPDACSKDKAASQLLRTRVLFKSWLMRRQEILRSPSLGPAALQDAFRGCATDLPPLLKLPGDAMTLDPVRVDTALDWDQALFVVHLFFDFMALSLGKKDSKNPKASWSVALTSAKGGGVLLNVREPDPGLLRKLKLDPGEKGPMAWLARRVLRKGGMLSMATGDGVEVTVMLPGKGRRENGSCP